MASSEYLIEWRVSGNPESSRVATVFCALFGPSDSVVENGKQTPRDHVLEMVV